MDTDQWDEEFWSQAYGLLTMMENKVRPATMFERDVGITGVRRGQYISSQDQYFIHQWWITGEHEDNIPGYTEIQEDLDERHAGSLYFYDANGSFPLCYLMDESDEWNREGHDIDTHDAFHRIRKGLHGSMGILSARSDRARRSAIVSMMKDESNKLSDYPHHHASLIFDESPRVVRMIAEKTTSIEALEYLKEHSDPATCHTATDRLAFEFETLDPQNTPITRVIERWIEALTE